MALEWEPERSLAMRRPKFKKTPMHSRRPPFSDRLSHRNADLTPFLWPYSVGFPGATGIGSWTGRRRTLFEAHLQTEVISPALQATRPRDFPTPSHGYHTPHLKNNPLRNQTWPCCFWGGSLSYIFTTVASLPPDKHQHGTPSCPRNSGQLEIPGSVDFKKKAGQTQETALVLWVFPKASFRVFVSVPRPRFHHSHPPRLRRSHFQCEPTNAARDPPGEQRKSELEKRGEHPLWHVQSTLHRVCLCRVC